MSKIDLNKMSGLLAPKGTPVAPASDAIQRSAAFAEKLKERKDEKTNASIDGIVNLSFKVPGSFRKRFKLAAINAGVTQNELVQQALVAWENQHKD